MKGRRWKRAAFMLFIAAWIFTSFAGCSKGGKSKGENSPGQGEGAQAKGRFLEEELDVGGMFSTVYDMRAIEDKGLFLVGQNGITPGVFKLADDGETFDKAYDFPQEIQSSADGWVNCAALSPDGRIVCALEQSEIDGTRAALYLIDKEGGTEEIPFELPELKESGKGDEDMGNRIEALQFPVNDWIVVQDSNGTVFQVNADDGSVKYKYEVGFDRGSFDIFAMGNTLIIQAGDQVTLYDMKTGVRKEAEEVFNGGNSKNGVFTQMDTLDGGESVYCLSQGGLYYYKFGGSVMEQLIDGNMNSLGTPDFYPFAMAMIDDENLLVAAYGNTGTEGPVFYKYTYSADAPAKPDKELKLYSLYDNELLRDVINRFRKEHSDVYVNYQIALSEDNGMTVSDVLKTLTTEIMAGNGPDVMLLDGMPVRAYTEKGVLRDLSPLLEEAGGDYFENIINAYQDEQGRLCAVPSRFLIPMIQAGSKYYAPGEDFDGFMEREGTMVNMMPQNVVAKFWYTCGAAWQKEDGTLDKDKVAEFLVKLKKGYGEFDSSMEEYEQEFDSMYLFCGDYELLEGNWNTNFGLRGYMDYGFEAAINEKIGGGCVDLMPGQADHVFVPFMVLGINSKSSQTELAEEFIKYLLNAKAAQGIYTQRSGFPVEKALFRSAIDGHVYEENQNNITSHFGDGETIEYIEAPTPEEEITRMTELVESLTTPSLQDDVIKEAVVEQGVKVLKGELSPEEGADAIIQKVNIYLAE